MTSLTDTSVTVSWNALIIPDFPIDSYTVVYSPVSESDRRQDGEMTAVFPGSVTSGVITDLESAVIYQFQVFSTVTANGVSVEGGWSDPVHKGINFCMYSNSLVKWQVKHVMYHMYFAIISSAVSYICKLHDSCLHRKEDDFQRASATIPIVK